MAKRQKVSPHHVDGLKNYFSFADTLDKRNKFLAFKLKDIQYKTPVLKDTTLAIFKFYTSYFQLNNNRFSYTQLDSILNADKVYKGLNFQYYYQDNLSYDSYLKIKINLYKYPFLRALDNPIDFYFK